MDTFARRDSTHQIVDVPPRSATASTQALYTTCPTTPAGFLMEPGDLRSRVDLFIIVVDLSGRRHSAVEPKRPLVGKKWRFWLVPELVNSDHTRENLYVLTPPQGWVQMMPNINPCRSPKQKGLRGLVRGWTMEHSSARLEESEQHGRISPQPPVSAGGILKSRETV